MYVFVGLGPVDLDSDDENSESDFLPPQMNDVRSFSHKNLEWTCHWWKGLPGPRTYYYNELGTPGVPLDTDLSVSPPIDGSGTLLAHTDPTTELERTYFSTTPRIEPRTRVEPGSLNVEDDNVDCIWIFCHAAIQANPDLGYWKQVPTRGT